MAGGWQGLAGKVVPPAMAKDLDEVLLEVGRKAPGRPVAVVGFSCGSGGDTKICQAARPLWWALEGSARLVAPTRFFQQLPNILFMVSTRLDMIMY